MIQYACWHQGDTGHFVFTWVAIGSVHFDPEIYMFYNCEALFIYFQVNVSSWVGWFVYSLIIMFLFMVLKIVNFRIHQSLGSDPVPDPPKEEEEEEEERGGEGKEKDGGKGSAIAAKEEEVKAELSGGKWNVYECELQNLVCARRHACAVSMGWVE